MAGKIKISFHQRVFLSLLSLCWLMVAAFLIFQYNREKKFRSELLNMELQMHNDRIIDDMRRGESIDSIVRRIGSPLAGLRLTLIAPDGQVVFDNNDRTPFPVTNHNNRPEVIKARKYGTGYSVERRSVSDDTAYFYSAALIPDGSVLRSAATYDHNIRAFLKADRQFLWIMLGITLAISMVGYALTRRVSTSIKNLNSFAEKASRGEPIYDGWAFPHDELGNIARNIVMLYLQRDRKHREAIHQEREAIRLKKQLTNNINHELKTPVAAIRINAELMRDHPELSAAQRRDILDRICTNTERLTSLLNDVATITRMDDGAQLIEKESADVSEIVNAVVADERLRTQMTITTEVPTLEMMVNRQLIESVFRNLIDNAIAYSGGTEIRIKADSRGHFTVSDNGCGIADEHLIHIFERFYRVDKGRSREKGGTGLGLSIVKHAIALHGGTIKATNDNGLRLDFQIL